MTKPPRPAPEPTEADACDLELLTLFSAGELDAAQRETVSAHLVDCDRCWHELRAQRVIIDAVQQLWKPAPAGLRADIRAAITADAQPRPLPRARRRRILVLAAAVLVAITTGGIVVNRLTSAPHDRPVAATTPIPTPVQAAIAQADRTPPAKSSAPPAPKLSGPELRLAASGSTKLGGITAAQYIFADRVGHHVTVYVAAKPWPRPQHAATVSHNAWIITPASVTVVGGPDQAGDQMLVIATDHTAAMTAAAELGLV